MQGVKEGGGRGAGGFSDIFDMFGMGGQGKKKGAYKGKSIAKEIKITLEDAYSGKMIK